MRIGTFLCWLFGHKFLFVEKEYNEQMIAVYTTKNSNYCVRCGIDKGTKNAK